MVRSFRAADRAELRRRRRRRACRRTCADDADRPAARLRRARWSRRRRSASRARRRTARRRRSTSDPATAWVTPFSDVDGQSVDVQLPDADHARPPRPPARRRRPALGADQDRGREQHRGAPRWWTSPRSPTRPRADAVVAAPVQFPPITGSELPGHGRRRPPGHDARVVLRVRPHDAGRASPSSGCRACRRSGCRDRLPGDCRDDLITIDGRPVPARVVGTTADALALQPLSLVSCTGSGVPQVDARAPGTTCCARPAVTGPASTSTGSPLASEAGGTPWTTLRRERRAGRVPAPPAAREHVAAGAVVSIGPDEDEGPDHGRDEAVLARAWGRAATRAGGPPSTARSWASPR